MIDATELYRTISAISTFASVRNYDGFAWTKYVPPKYDEMEASFRLSIPMRIQPLLDEVALAGTKGYEAIMAMYATEEFYGLPVVVHPVDPETVKDLLGEVRSSLPVMININGIRICVNNNL